ncbi:hypothetical protein AHAS_Ahas07G0114100 [Arachis hypogaea]
MSSYDTLEAECLHQFETTPKKTDYRGSCIKLTWLQNLKAHLVLTDEIGIQRYRQVRSNSALEISVDLQNFAGIREFS